jgi:hypothetical protein
LAKLHAGLWALPLGVAITAFSPNAFADTKFELGFRTGYGIPFGKIYDREETDSSNNDIKDGVAGQIPLWVDIGARLNGQLFIGGYVVYGVGLLADEFSNDCDDADQAADALGGSVSCSVSDVRLGANVHYHFGAPGASLDPWIGAGLGYEWLTLSEGISVGSQAVDLSITLHGFEFANLQAGLDFPLSEVAALGPFVAVSFASYGTGRVTCSGDCGTADDTQSESIDDTSVHEWLFLGVRAAFVF